MGSLIHLSRPLSCRAEALDLALMAGTASNEEEEAEEDELEGVH